MDSAEISRTTRWGMIFVGLLQGTLCYLLMTYLAPHNDGWLFYGMPATIAITSALLLTVVSFKQRALWYWMALIFTADGDACLALDSGLASCLS